MNVQLLFLGPVRQPEYCHDSDWYDPDVEKIRYYHISYGTGWSVGNTIKIDSYRLEVYRIHSFLEEDDYCIDNDLVTLDDYIVENCEGLYEI